MSLKSKLQTWARPCMKVKHATRDAAQLKLIEVRSERSSRGEAIKRRRKDYESHVYLCPKCGFWHLTSMDPSEITISAIDMHYIIQSDDRRKHNGARKEFKRTLDATRDREKCARREARQLREENRSTS